MNKQISFIQLFLFPSFLQNWVTRERCMNYVIMRGLSRAWITIHVDRILFYLTLKGYINHGVASPPKEIEFIEPLEENFQKVFDEDDEINLHHFVYNFGTIFLFCELLFVLINMCLYIQTTVCAYWSGYKALLNVYMI